MISDPSLPIDKERTPAEMDSRDTEFPRAPGAPALNSMGQTSAQMSFVMVSSYL